MPAFGCNEQVKQTRLSNTENHDMVADGKFYLVTKDDDADYMIGPVTSKAENMPQKVKEFF